MQTREIMDLVLPFKNKLYRFALSIIKNTHDAEEVVQDLLVKIWKKKNLFLSIDKEACCMTVTRNLAFDRLRVRKSPTVGLETVYHVRDHSASPEQTLVSKVEMKRIIKMIESLPEDLKMVIQLR